MVFKNSKAKLPAKKVVKIEKQNDSRKRKASESLTHAEDALESSTIQRDSADKEVNKKNVKNKNIGKNIQRKPTGQSGVPTIKSFIPKAYPYELTVEVANLPQNYKQMNIVETFNKYGSITYVQNLSKKKAIVAFLKQEEAAAALQANKIARIDNQVLTVKKRSKKLKEVDEIAQRTIFVFRVNSRTTEEDITKHFEACGKILSVKAKKRASENYFIVEFADKVASQAALRLHNSNLKESILTVRLKSKQYVPWYPTRTVVLLNENGLTKLEGSSITSIFEKCGEIENCDVLCEKQKLAIITFKNERDATKALKLNGKSENGLFIAVELYATELQRNSIPPKVNPHAERLDLARAKKIKVYIKKISKNTSEEDLLNLFTSCGSVKKVNILPEKGAVIEFSDSDGYCKAFSLHTLQFKGQELYIVPFSENPQNVDKNPKKRTSTNASGPPRKLKKKV